MELGKLGQQVELEKKSRDSGIKRAKERNKKLRDSGFNSMTASGKAIVSGYVETIADAIRVDLEASVNGGKSGRNFRAFELLMALEVETIAVIALKATINVLNSTNAFTVLAVQVGRHIEDEIKLRMFEEEAPALFKKTYEDLKSRAWGYKYKRRKLREVAKSHEVEWSEWTLEQRTLVGVRLLDYVLELTNLIEVELRQDRKKKRRTVNFTEEAIQWISKRDFLQGINEPEFLPMICRPRPWAGVVSKRDPKENKAGGYLTLNAPQLNLVKSYNRDYLEELESFDLSQVYRPLNALQDTQWVVDEEQYKVAIELWDNHSELGRLPSQSPVDLPPKPKDIDTNAEARKAWRREAVKKYTEKNRSQSKRYLTSRTLQMAKDFLEYDPIHFVYTLDFRHRAYPVVSYLQPQGADLSRSLLRYSDHHAKQMNDEAARELAIYGASLYGVDKVSLDDRVAWVEENSDAICASGENPFENRLWCDPKKSFLFLSFCREWLGWKTRGKDFYTTLPVMRDGTCNAIQHWAALLLDADTGAHVNLISSDIPGDVYTTSLVILKERLERKALVGDEFAKGWLAYGLDRELVKKPNMTLAYGAKRYSMTDGIADWVTKRRDEGIAEPFEGHYWKQAIWLTNEIWDAISRTVGSVMIGMKFLQDCARVCLKAKQPMSWITPTNFYVRQAYLDLERRKVKTKLLGDTITLAILKEKKNEYHYHRMVNAISANFVHSLDASAMFITTNKALDRGVTAFSMIHDSYGTTAVDTPVLSECTREAFVEMYLNNNFLSDFRGHLKEVIPESLKDQIPKLPSMGSLDIKSILQSDHFFS